MFLDFDFVYFLGDCNWAVLLDLMFYDFPWPWQESGNATLELIKDVN